MARRVILVMACFLFGSCATYYEDLFISIPPSDFQFEGWVFQPELTVVRPRWGPEAAIYSLEVNISAKPMRSEIGVVPKVDSLLLRVDASEMHVLTPTVIDTADFVMEFHMGTLAVPAESRNTVLWLFLSDTTGQSVRAYTSSGDSLEMMRHVQSFLWFFPLQ